MNKAESIPVKVIDASASERSRAADFVPLHASHASLERAVDRQVELSPIHDFSAKLRQPDLIERLKEYVRWQRDWRDGYAKGISLDEALKSAPVKAPISINLDLTTACNYRCDHCVDMDILNTGIRYDHEALKDSLTELAKNGLKSVIVIGGGEPTAYPGFEEIIRLLKSLDLRVGIVSNGSLLKKVLNVADCLTGKDWLRLSLDSGTNETFYAMHKPGKKSITLDWICEGVAPIKKANPEFQIGYSYIIVWNDCEANDTKIIENVDEMVMAAERAKNAGFDYISYKPFLTRAPENNAEVVDLVNEEPNITPVMARIQEQIDAARPLEDDSFRIVESTNLRVFRNGSYDSFTHQPATCHMQYFRQILSPLGIYNCPVYRNIPKAGLGEKHAYANKEGLANTVRETLRLTDSFNANEECKHVTCLYNNANWFIEDLIRNPEKLESLSTTEARQDYFL